MKHNRGEPKNYENIETQKLDILAKILCKGVYTSVVKHADPTQPGIYVTYPVGKYNSNMYSIDLKGLKNFQSILNKQNKKDEASIQTELFNMAKKHQNSFISQMKKNYEESIQEKLRNNEITKGEYDQQLAMNRSEIYKNDFLSEADLNLLLSLNVEKYENFWNLNLVPNRGKKEYLNVHTEAVGVHYLSNKEDALKHYLIGLGNESGLDVGCCAGCTKEFTILEGRGYTIERTRDFPHNLPINNYKPSPSISPDDYNEFVTEEGIQIPIIMGDVH